MNVFFGTTPFYRFEDESYSKYVEPLSSMYLIPELLRDLGCHVDVNDSLMYDLEHEPARLVRRALRCDAVFLSTTSFNWAYILRFIRLLDLEPHRPPIVVGGVHATLIPEHIIRSSPADIVVAGEGEHAVADLTAFFMGKRALDSIPGIHYREHGEIRTTGPRPYMTSEELGRIPPIRWDDLTRPPSYLGVQTARGCLMSCRFCSIPYRKSWRSFPVDHILASLSNAVKKIGDKPAIPIVFADDCFTPDRAFSVTVLREVKNAFPQVKLQIEARVRDLLRPGFLEEIFSFDNIQMIQIGVEAGTNSGLRKIRKGLTTEEVEELGRRAHALGVGKAIRYSYMIGFPWEELSDIQSTIDFAFRVAVPNDGVVQINWWMPVPGNSLFKEIENDYGIGSAMFDTPCWSIERKSFLRSHPWVRERDINEIRSYANFLALLHYKTPRIGSAFSGPWEDLPEAPLHELDRMLKDNLRSEPGQSA